MRCTAQKPHSIRRRTVKFVIQLAFLYIYLYSLSIDKFLFSIRRRAAWLPFRPVRCAIRIKLVSRGGSKQQNMYKKDPHTRAFRFIRMTRLFKIPWTKSQSPPPPAMDRAFTNITIAKRERERVKYSFFCLLLYKHLIVRRIEMDERVVVVEKRGRRPPY